MTREEAIAILQDEAYFLYEDDVPYNRQAFEMAIQALSQEPTEKPMCDRNICISNEYNGIGCDECVVNKEQEPCTDAVSRDALLGETIRKNSIWNSITNSEGKNLEEIIFELPSVTQKSGKWINVNDMLPREREDVIVTCFVHENWQTKIGYWNGKAWVVNAYDILFIDRLEVTAWMPLPEPYEPQESEDKE